MLSRELVGRRVKVTAGDDHGPSVAAHFLASTPPPEGAVGTVTHIHDLSGKVTVRIEGINRVYTIPVGDVEVLP